MHNMNGCCKFFVDEVGALPGAVQSVNLSKNTLTIQLRREFAGKKKGDPMTFDLLDQVTWEGTSGKSLSDLKPGDLVEFEVKEFVYYIRVHSDG
ncbi:MAG: copper-binding protein [Nitrospira sp.]|nr:copper-binding protein [Nitrospira sp.]